MESLGNDVLKLTLMLLLLSRALDGKIHKVGCVNVFCSYCAVNWYFKTKRIKIMTISD